VPNQTVFNLGNTYQWGEGPPIHPDDPLPLKVAKKLMSVSPRLYVKQADGTYVRYRVGTDCAETDSDTIVFTTPVD